MVDTRWRYLFTNIYMPGMVTGGYVGLICGNFLSGALTSAYGWEIVFYVLGLLLVIWFCFWSFLVYNEPGTHPRISRVRPF